MKNNITEILEELTLKEKASMFSGGDFWQTETIERLSIPAIFLVDGPHGVRNVVDRHHTDPAKKATCFPTAVNLAASWDLSLIEKVAEALAEESKCLGVDVLLGPGINMKRSPLGGRNFEYFSEDPFLTAELAIKFINTVQRKGIGTSLKHYIANNQEYKRFSIDAQIDERPLREIYLSAFEKIVKKANPWTIMAAYNQVNGDFATESSYLLKKILRNEWGYKNLVVSDWRAVHNRVEALKAGLDLEMPGSVPINDQKILDAVESGELIKEKVDQSIKRQLDLILKSQSTKKENIDLPIEKHHQLSKEIASETIVLLKNQGKLLPLTKERLDDTKSMLVVGELAKKIRYQGIGSSQVNPTKLDTHYKALKDKFDKQLEVDYAEGYKSNDKLEENENLKQKALSTAKNKDYVIVYAGLPDKVEAEGYDRENIKLPKEQNELIKELTEINSNVIVVLNNGSAVDLREWIDKVSAVIEAGLPGQAGALALADIISGEVNPSAKLTESYPLKLEDNPSYLNFPGNNGIVRYGEGIYIGYRYYDKKKMEVLFPFGYGLSYTEFAYRKAEVPNHLEEGENLKIKVLIENTGLFKGKEIVQVYISQEKPRLDRPPKELKGFGKIELDPGEEGRLELELDYQELAYYHPEEGWVVESDYYKLMIGASSRDIKITEKIWVESSTIIKGLTKKSPFIDWLNDPFGHKAVKKVLTEEQIKEIEYHNSRPIYRLHFYSPDQVSLKNIEDILDVYQNL
ncbi:glycoside hydrolase family 3 C-terminal domain-containing protein [Halanaerobiaceae bacterium Z-7014]|uniref:Glycoside hydrolase family 3 C-terminal domain-containing protein n=1 Tax=Halonatronomonas betaini TaxID=2778430 RepID=A0A931F995_9FIRM|nr:glycoside hydrolase family 3 C-terminal domain-containing protein [Halonatronomonas betaini]MBF8436199.1 glycoside hydrolase family 3 C-terminal domain-containing protein [Halonatronomonas betaini]